MEDWAKRLDAFLEFDEWEILQDGGKVTAKLAKDCAESEFEKFRIVQDPWVPPITTSQPRFESPAL
jgi:hypothetical protein